MLIEAVSPLRVVPCQAEDPSPILTSPTKTAFGATKSASRVFGNIEFEIGTHLKDGTIVSWWP